MASNTDFSDDDSISSETKTRKRSPENRSRESPETITGDTTHDSTNDSIETILRAFGLPELIESFQCKYH